MERCIIEVVTSIDIGMSIKKEHDALMIAILCCIMERCFVSVTKGIDIGMSIKKKLHICPRALLGCFNKIIIELLLLSSSLS